jgi:hypothetical protein
MNAGATLLNLGQLSDSSGRSSGTTTVFTTRVVIVPVV